MEESIIRFNCEVDSAGYDLLQRVHTDTGTLLSQITQPTSGTYLVGRGGKQTRLDIGLRERDVFIELGNTSPTPEGALAFTKKWGQLDNTVWRLDHFLQVRDSMARSLTKTGLAVVKQALLTEHNHGSLKIEIEKGRLVLRAYALYQFCWLERLHAIEGGIDIAQCGGCGTFLRISYQKGRPMRHCSSACKQKMYRRRKNLS